MQNRPWQTVLLATALAGLAGPAVAHRERPIASPVRAGTVPDLARTHRTTLVVCKASSRPTRAALDEIRGRLRAGGAERARAKAELATWKRNTKLFRKCRYEHIQAAVHDAPDGTAILVLPGVYREEPSRAQPSHGMPDLPDGSYSYEYHLAHPNDANLIAILGKTGITLEGTGDDPRDVVVDAGFVKDVPIRADRADGIIIRNLWARDGNEHCIYVVETAGYAFDRTVGSFCREYELFSFASDLGLFTDCEAEGGGDSGIYTGGNPDTSAEGRFSAEIRRCRMHTNALGFSGTQGNSVWMHDNDVFGNAVGLSFNTQNDHPNAPQRQSLIENNLIHDNNLDIYAADTPTPAGGPAYGVLRYPVGTGMWIVGGDDNVIRNNFIYGNQRFGIMVFGNPLDAGPVLAETNRNQVYGNVIGVAPDGTPRPNGTALPPGTTAFVEGATDLFWGGSGTDNCWGPQDARSGPITYGPSTIAAFQPCPFANAGNGGALPRIEVANLLLSCLLEEDPAQPGRFVTADDVYPCPWGHESFAPYQNRDEQECGNQVVDLGEECDGGYPPPPGWPLLDPWLRACSSFGLGTGRVRCDARCDFDASECTASVCGAFANGSLAARGVGDDATARATIAISGMDVAGRTFDPTTDGFSLVIGTPDLSGNGVTVRADSPGWRATGDGWRFAGTVRSLRARVRIRRAGALDVRLARTSIADGEWPFAAIVARIGDDCWRGELSCQVARSGAKVACVKRHRP
jgi:hypothetical protein